MDELKVDLVDLFAEHMEDLKKTVEWIVANLEEGEHKLQLIRQITDSLKRFFIEKKDGEE